MSTPRYEDHPGPDQSRAAERRRTAHRSSVPDGPQQIVVHGPGARAAANSIPLRGQAYLHPLLKLLGEAPIAPLRIDRKYRHLRLVDTSERWGGNPDGCSPCACRSGHAAASWSVAS